MLLTCFADDELLYIVMEFCSGGTLTKVIFKQEQKGEPFSEQQILKWFAELSAGIEYLHDRKIIHRDIKPDVS